MRSQAEQAQATFSPSSAGGWQSEQMNIAVVGHVDHGKSTVIGRLLADTNTLPEGKLQQIKDLCERTSKPFEYAFLIDALKDERAQGITIDSARVFFRSDKRSYIIIDAPGHIEFLKNMITGASRADAALLVIDANEGVQENSRRHGYMLSMLGIRHVAVLVNKMDLVGYSEEVFEAVREEYGWFLDSIGLEPAAYIPVSGTNGDNIARLGAGTPWYRAHTVLELLDGFPVRQPDDKLPLRLPVQDVYKFTRYGDDRRIIAGTILTGSLRAGDRVVFYPSGKSTTVRSIETFPAVGDCEGGAVGDAGDGPSAEDSQRRAAAGDGVAAGDGGASGQSAGGLARAAANGPLVASAPDAVGFTLGEQLYITRGDLVARDNEVPLKVATRLKASVFWLSRQPMVCGKEYLLRLGTAKVPVRLESISRLIDASDLSAVDQPEAIGRHDVAECVLRCDQPLAFDLAGDIAETGRFVIIDDYEISGGGIVQEALPDEQSFFRDRVILRNIKWLRSDIALEERAERYCQRPALVLVTGARGSRKNEVARAVEAHLFTHGRFTYYLGLGSLLYGVDADLKWLEQDSRVEHREEHLRRFAEVAHLFLTSGLILVVSAVELTRADLSLIHTVLQRYPVFVLWVGDQVLTDVPLDTRLGDGEPLEAGVGRVKALLQDAGLIYRA